NTTPEERTLKNIWVDATTNEASQYPPGSPVASGLVYPLESSSTIRRGKGAQSPVFPPKYRSPQNLPISTHNLVLKSVQSTPRSLVLEF
ncbi:hypothetical protein M413DRAFT_35516, partial [Hebeloma cylindrosporum]